VLRGDGHQCRRREREQGDRRERGAIAGRADRSGGVIAAKAFCPVFWTPSAGPARDDPAYSATTVNASPFVLTASTWTSSLRSGCLLPELSLTLMSATRC
jgi:hypothetical protein